MAPLKTTLQNPSQISLDTIGVSLPVIFNGVTIGRAAINVRCTTCLVVNIGDSLLLQEFDLVPGANIVDTEFHYQPANSNDTIAQVCTS